MGSVLTTYVSGGVSTVWIQGNKTDRTNLCRDRDTEETDEADVLVPDDLDLINQAEPAEIIPQLFFGCVLVQPSEVHVPAGVALLNRQGDLAGNRGGLSPQPIPNSCPCKDNFLTTASGWN